MKNSTLFILLLIAYTNLQAQDLKVTDGYLLINNYALVLKDMDLVNDGTISSNKGNVYLTGENTTNISGENTPNFDSLTITKTNGDVTLGTDIIIDKQFKLAGGKLSLLNSNATLSSDANIEGANSNRYVQTNGTGQLFQYVPTTNTAITFPVGNSTYNPAILQMDSGVADFYGLRVKEEVLENGVSGNLVTDYVVNRTWELSETSADGTNLNLTLHWDSEQAVGYTGSNWTIANYDGGWNFLDGSEDTNFGLNSIQTYIGEVGNYAIFEDRSPLVEGYFCDNSWNISIDDVIADLVNHRALNDLTSDQAIESAANVLFTAGNSITLLDGFEVKAGAYFHAYIATCEFAEELIELESRTEELTAEPITKMQLKVYPNPFNQLTNIEFSLLEAQSAHLIISDLQGKIIKEQTYNDTFTDWQKTTFESGNLPAGMYILTLQSGKEVLQKQLVLME